MVIFIDSLFRMEEMQKRLPEIMLQKAATLEDDTSKGSELDSQEAEASREAETGNETQA